MKNAIKKSEVEALIRLALEEDIGAGDITSQAIFDSGNTINAEIVSKQRGIACGADIARFVYEIIDPAIRLEPHVPDGDSIMPGDRLLSIHGPTISVLSGERTVLNFLQRMAGIATRTAEAVSLLKETRITLLDTRKTAPGHRVLDKYAVRTGGGTNHRAGLFDMVMIKDNHIKAAGGIAKAVGAVRMKLRTRYPIEVETANLEEVREAAEAGVDIIMLDNMDLPMIRAAIGIVKKRAKIEISGNVDEQKIRQIAGLDVDYLSMGALTHSVRAFDLSMKFY